MTGLVLLVVSLLLAPLSEAFGVDAWGGYPSQGLVLSLLVVTVIIGELRPVPVPRGGDTADMITISTTFTLTLAIVGSGERRPAGSGCRRAHRRRDLPPVALSRSRSTSRSTSSPSWPHTPRTPSSSGEPVFGPYNFFDHNALELAGALVAAFVFLLVNQALVSTVVSLASEQQIRTVFVQDLRFQAMTAGVLSILAPVAALVVQTQPLMLPMLIAPVAAVLQQRQARRRDGPSGEPRRADRSGQPRALP